MPWSVRAAADRVLDLTSDLNVQRRHRFDDHFATVEVGRSLVLGIHPRTPRTPVPGTKGSVTLGLVLDEPLDSVLSRLARRGVRTAGQAEPRRSVDVEDLDGNVITLWAQAWMPDAELTASASAR